MTGLYLPDNVLWTIAGIFALLTAVSTLIFVGAGVYPGVNHSELRLRTQSWWFIAVLFTAGFAAGRTALLVLLAVVSFLALKEYLSLIPTRRADRRVLLWTYLTIPVQYIVVDSESYALFLTYIPVYFFIALPIWMIAGGETRGYLSALGMLYWGVMAAVFSLSHMAYLTVLPIDGNPVAGGAGLLLFLIVLTESNDVAQYCCGKAFGRHKLAPRISPSKTREGLIGGLAITALLAAMPAPLLTPFSTRESVIAGLLIAVVGSAGDLAMSAVKRDLGIKNSGRLLPGHGGILDRVDSLVFTAPVFFHFTYFLHF